MQEVAIILSSVAGLASAVALRLPRTRQKAQAGNIDNTTEALEAEREILDKAITKLYNDRTMPDAVRNRLVSRYQQQLGTILDDIERRKDAKTHPDMGQVSQELAAVMEKKMAVLDSRLSEISSKIAVRENKRAGTESSNEPKKHNDSQATRPATGRQDSTSLSGPPDTKHGNAATLSRPKTEQSTAAPVIARSASVPGKGTGLSGPIFNRTANLPKSNPAIVNASMTNTGKNPAPQVRQDPGRIATRTPISRDVKPSQTGVQDTDSPAATTKIGTHADKTRQAAAREPGTASDRPRDADLDDIDNIDDLEDVKKDILKTLSKLEQAEVE